MNNDDVAEVKRVLTMISSMHIVDTAPKGLRPDIVAEGALPSLDRIEAKLKETDRLHQDTLNEILESNAKIHQKEVDALQVKLKAAEGLVEALDYSKKVIDELHSESPGDYSKIKPCIDDALEAWRKT